MYGWVEFIMTATEKETDRRSKDIFETFGRPLYLLELLDTQQSNSNEPNACGEIRNKENIFELL